MPVGPKDLERRVLSHSQAEIVDSIIRGVDTELKQRMLDGNPIHIRIRLPDLSSSDECKLIMDEVVRQYRAEEVGWKQVDWGSFDFDFVPSGRERVTCSTVVLTFRAE